MYVTWKSGPWDLPVLSTANPPRPKLDPRSLSPPRPKLGPPKPGPPYPPRPPNDPPSLPPRPPKELPPPKPPRENGEPPEGPFDAALVDVPCSNTGVLGRRPEVRWRLKPNEFEFLIRLQTRLLIQASERVKPGGAIVYSTCSIEPEENAGVVKAVLRGMRNVKLEAEHVSAPGKPADGGYWARLRKALNRA